MHLIPRLIVLFYFYIHSMKFLFLKSKLLIKSINDIQKYQNCFCLFTFGTPQFQLNSGTETIDNLFYLFTSLINILITNEHSNLIRDLTLSGNS